jgi:hypothetical protein
MTTATAATAATADTAAHDQDFLDEDAPISNQKFFVLSYILPNKPSDPPMFKVRGSTSTIEECEKRIKRLQNTDTYFNMYIAEVGKWGALLSDEQIRAQDIDSIYDNKGMNELVKGYKENKDKLDREYIERTEHMKQKARQEGSKEGQKTLADSAEKPITIKIRLEGIDTQILKMEQELEGLRKTREENIRLWEGFSEQDIKDSEKEFEEYTKSLKIKE